jgi:hypothetical protein
VCSNLDPSVVNQISRTLNIAFRITSLSCQVHMRVIPGERGGNSKGVSMK